MKNKGFTLIEILAVIVILAIIALIATPIIINIINDSRESANKRTIELYGTAVANAVAKEQLNGNEVAPGALSATTLQKVQYSGEEVSCSTTKLNRDGSIYLAGCTINDTPVDYTYGINKPLYYYYSEDVSGNIGDSLPNAASISAPNNDFYLGFDVDIDNNITEAYACFIRSGKEYCLKGNDTDAYKTNQGVIADAYAEVADTNACSFGAGYSYCQVASEDLFMDANSSGTVNAGGPVALNAMSEAIATSGAIRSSSRGMC